MEAISRDKIYFLPIYFRNIVKGVIPHTICHRNYPSTSAKTLDQTTEKPVVTTTLSYNMPTRTLDVIRM